jgi:hypothetical protein
MKSLLSGIDSQVGKKAYQTYTVQHGFEKLEVIVPVENTAAFEIDLKESLRNIEAVLEVLHLHSGELKEKAK